MQLAAPFAPSFPIRSAADVRRLEAVPLAEQLTVRSTYEILRNSAAAFGDKTAITFLPRADPAQAPQRWSYRELLRNVNRTANLLHSLGVGPRDINATQNNGALGGTVFAVGTVEARLPGLLPESYGVSAGLFTDFGTLGRLDVKPANTGPCIIHSGLGSCIKDNMAFRASAGITIGCKSPFGPVQIDLGLPLVKTKYDRPLIMHFSSATGL